ncbi:MAG: nickel-dependent lactate racemase [Spirochaetota bacterium]
MNVRVAYGKKGVDVVLPDDAEVSIIEPRHVPGATDQRELVARALEAPVGAAPLRETVRATDRIAIAFSDITRPTPYDILLPPLLDQLSHVPDRNIVLFNATGTHRENTEAELRTILGDEIFSRFRVVQNRSDDDDSHRMIGTTDSGNRVSVLGEFLDCDVKIATGFIEPHFFAGMSGGGKAIVPGLASLGTIQRNHSAAHMDDPMVGWGVTEGNPLWEELRDAALLADPSFILNVALNRDKEITAVFAGEFLEAHRVGCEYVRTHAMAGVESEFDIVITSNSGYPLDLNMYQSVKGMSAASQIVRPGGHIVIAAECWDGIPEHGQYGRLLGESESLEALLAKIRSPGFTAADMWQAQIHALICQKATVHFYSENLTDDQVRSGFMHPVSDIGDTVRALIATGSGTRIAVLPEGPTTIPFLT